MKFALVNGNKTSAEPSLNGICPFCNSEVIAKCGKINIWHWAHIPRKNCDKWWENETEWHRKWKNYFNIRNQEIIHFAEDGEKHIADIKTDDDLIIELQNSSISYEEIQSRNSFYKKIIWIVNGESFRERFFILHPLPDPDSKEMEDIRIKFDGHKDHYPAFYRVSENEIGATMVLIHSFNDISELVNDQYVGHHLFSWKNARTNWYNEEVPIFIDFGDNFLYKLERYGESKIFCIKIVNKKKLVEENGGQYMIEGDPTVFNAIFLEGK